MFRKKGQITLKETIESLNPKQRKKKKYRRLFCYLLLTLVVWCFRGYILFIEGVILLLSLFQLGLNAKRPGTEKSKLQIKRKKEVRILPLAILAVYFAVLGIVFSLYGGIKYVLHLSAIGFDFRQWLYHSISVFLIFEVIAVRICIMAEREES